VVALRGRATGERSGRLLARTAHMPSRPMNSLAAPRQLALRGTLPGGTRIAIDLTQPAGDGHAKGTIRLLGARDTALVEATDLGVLQTTKQWASITGIARTASSGELRAFTLTVEDADPFVAGHPRTVTIERHGEPTLNGVLR